jgi:hypothetical protein
MTGVTGIVTLKTAVAAQGIGAASVRPKTRSKPTNHKFRFFVIFSSPYLCGKRTWIRKRD